MSEFSRVRYNETCRVHKDGQRNLNHAPARACSCAESAVEDIRRGHLRMRKMGHLYSLYSGKRVATVQKGENHRGDEWAAYAVDDSSESLFLSKTMNEMANVALVIGAHQDRLMALLELAYAFGMVCLARYNSYGYIQVWKDRIDERDLEALRQQREYGQS